MKSIKSILIYIAGVAILIIVSILSTGRLDVVINELPTPTPGSLATAQPSQITRPDCFQTARSFTHNYVPQPPLTVTHTTLGADLPGEPLTVSGTVYAADRQTPLPGAMITVWQADAEGHYNRAALSAQIQTDREGRYEFTAIKPGHYRVGCQYLPAHIHYRIHYRDHKPIFRSLLFEDDPHLTNILITELTQIRPLTIQSGPEGAMLHTTFDIILPVNNP